MGADIGVALPRPSQRRALRVVDISTLQPPVLLQRELPALDLRGQLLRPPLRNLERLAPPPTVHEHLSNRTVPHAVKVHVGAAPLHVYPIAAPRDVLVVQRLVQVPDEVHDELGGQVPVAEREGRVERLEGVVGEGGDDAACVFAVARKVDVAGEGRVVFRVDEVEGLGEAAPLGVPDRVGPRGDVGEVVRRVVIEDVLEVGLGRVGDEVRREVGRRDVPEA